MTNETEIREFLTSRRAKITPEAAGLPVYGRQRRVTGLRREEVAMLAGISAEYYTRLERGNARGVSESVLESVSRALRLDDAEHAHLLDLARTANLERPPRRKQPTEQVRPSVARVVNAMADIPAYVRNGRLDFVYGNELARSLFSEVLKSQGPRPNLARFVFLDPRSRLFWVDWERAAADTVAILRGEAGRNPFDRALTDLIGELSTRSDEFRVRWAAHDVRFHFSGTKHIRHPLVGELTLAFEGLALPVDDGLSIHTYTAEPGSLSEARLRELAEWSSTRQRLAGNPSDATRA